MWNMKSHHWIIELFMITLIVQTIECNVQVINHAETNLLNIAQEFQKMERQHIQPPEKSQENKRFIDPSNNKDWDETSCPDGQFKLKEDGKCERCPAQCSECQDLKGCVKCK